MLSFKIKTLKIYALVLTILSFLRKILVWFLQKLFEFFETLYWILDISENFPVLWHEQAKMYSLQKKIHYQNIDYQLIYLIQYFVVLSRFVIKMWFVYYFIDVQLIAPRNLKMLNKNHYKIFPRNDYNIKTSTWICKNSYFKMKVHF